MKHLKFFWLVVGLIGVAWAGLACTSQSQPKVMTVGVINRVPGLNPVVDGFKAKMTELGYTEGKNITYIDEGAITDTAKVAPYAQKLAGSKVDLILAVTRAAANAAQQATSDIPIVFAPVINPVDSGLVDNLIKPGRNATGVTNAGGDPPRLQRFLEIDPQIKRIFVPYNPDDVSPATAFKSINEVAQSLKVELVPYAVRQVEANTGAMADIPDDVDAVFLLPDDMVIIRIKDWVEIAKQKKLPISVPQVFPSALMSFCFDSFTMGQQAGRLADKILKGAKPGDMPVENAELFLTIDLTTAQAINLKIPDTVLEQAHTLIRE
jgi:putative tryptophan/tyrosine transport system substrate-binding protein